MDLQDIERLAPFSRGSTEIFKTGLWSPHKPVYVEKTSPCRQACPAGIDIARAFYHASKGEYDEALRIYRQDNPLPGVCGRVCYHPCEMECNRKEFDQAVNIRAFERFLSDHGRVDLKREAPTRLRKERIAVIGSGPAGLSAAYHLARLGYGVTILEALPEPGGMLRYGIPAYRLPMEILRKEIGFIRQLGVEIRTGVGIGKDQSLSEIQKTFQALFIAVGAHGGLRLGLKGEESPQVLEGIKFLRDIRMGEKIEVGRQVAVIGGGNTAVDCARTARRLGGKEVRIIYRRSRAEMPALSEEVASAEREGIKLGMLSTPRRLIFEKSRLSAIEVVRMELGVPDEKGRPMPVPIPGTEHLVPVDTLIAAIGQVPETSFVKDLDLSVDPMGLINISPETAATNIPGVFAGGDSAGGQAFVADAIGSGKQGALAISCYLEGKDLDQEFKDHRIGKSTSFSFQHFMTPDRNPIDLKTVVPFDKINTLCFPYQARRDNPEGLPPEEGLDSFEETTEGLLPAEMEAEMARCFQCGTCTGCDLCFLICPDLSIIKAGKNGYSIKKDYCKGCGMCASTCPRQVIEMDGGQ